jgi:hypothetical protein
VAVSVALPPGDRLSEIPPGAEVPMSPQPARPVRASIAVLLSALLLIQTTGCTSWPTAAQPWPTTVAEHPNRRVQVTLHDGTVVKGDSASSRTDVLLIHQRQAVDTLAVEEINQVRFRQVSAVKTVAAVLGGIVAAIGIAVAIWLIDCGGTNCIGT